MFITYILNCTINFYELVFITNINIFSCFGDLPYLLCFKEFVVIDNADYSISIYQKLAK